MSETKRAEGTIQTTSWEPKPYEAPAEGPQLVIIEVTETFSGDLEGHGTVRFLQALRGDGSATFVGIERFTGALAGRRGTFLLQDAGTLEGTHVQGEWFVVPGSGTGELQGLTGRGGFEADVGKNARIWLDYRFA